MRVVGSNPGNPSQPLTPGSHKNTPKNIKNDSHSDNTVRLIVKKFANKCTLKKWMHKKSFDGFLYI